MSQLDVLLAAHARLVHVDHHPSMIDLLARPAPKRAVQSPAQPPPGAYSVGQGCALTSLPALVASRRPLRQIPSERVRA